MINLSVPTASPARYSRKLFPGINDHRNSIVNYLEDESTKDRTEATNTVDRINEFSAKIGISDQTPKYDKLDKYRKKKSSIYRVNLKLESKSKGDKVKVRYNNHRENSNGSISSDQNEGFSPELKNMRRP